MTSATDVPKPWTDSKKKLSTFWLDNLDHTSTPQLPFKRPQIPSNRDHMALNGGTLGGLGIGVVESRIGGSTSTILQGAGLIRTPRTAYSGFVEVYVQRALCYPPLLESMSQT